MIKLNNKGVTIVEILVCFLLVSFITTSLYTTVSSFNNKRGIESVRADLLQYRNDIDKLIEDDLIHKGLIDAKITTPTNTDAVTKYNIELFFRDGSKKVLIIYSQRAGEYGSSGAAGGDEATCTGNSDKFYIGYGTVENTGDYLKYTLPNVGSSVNKSCTPEETIMDLRFNSIEVKNSDNVLFIYINFYHPELGNDYSINIVAPINYFA